VGEAGTVVRGYQAVAPHQLTITNWALSRTTLSLSSPGSSLTYAITMNNAGSRTIPLVGYQGWIEQGTARRAAGGALVFTCGDDIGDFKPGPCTQNFTLGTGPNAAGTGTLVPGPATARLVLSHMSGYEDDSVTVAITLVN
jgi:hypothetical protein